MVDKTETTFNVSHLRMDEYVFSARRILTEGEKPKLELVIENPRVGLLSALREQWCWFAWDNGSEVVPLFFGRIVGIPSDMESEVITVTFIAWPANYKKQLQNVATALKIAPYYDPVLIDVAKRDDPMTIFETYNSMIFVDPVTHVVSTSDILDAEDGNIDFTEDDHFYSSVKVNVGAVPKTAVHVDMSVSWTQTARGYLDMGTNLLTSYTGDGIISEWPKPLSQIAPGLNVFSSLAHDVNNTGSIVTSSFNGSYQNKAKEHNDGDALSSSWSWTTPQIHGPFKDKTLTFKQIIGVQDPLTVDSNGDPDPTNISPVVEETHGYVPLWTVKTSMVIEYTAERPHTERVIFTLFAGVQSTTLDPLVTEDSETIVLSGSDVGVPLIDLLNWTTVSGEYVDVGTIIFPNDPLLPGNSTAQVCTDDGITGTGTEPNFSDVVGTTTLDGTATWASLGVATPPDNAPDWTGTSNVPTGTMILPRRPLYTTWDYLTAASRAVFPPQGASVSESTIILTKDGSFQVCTQSGTTNKVEEPTGFSATWGVDTIDGSVTWTSLGNSLPSGTTFFVATTGGLTNDQANSTHVIPPFDETIRATTTDGTVTWTAVAIGEIPVGGTPGNVTASDYFARERGKRTLEYGLCRARARLRYASRCVSTQFQCTYARGIEVTLRNSVTLHDHRLPGGVVAGKVVGTELLASSGSFTCSVTLGSSVGLAETIEEVPGEPTYVEDGYMTYGQVRSGEIVLVPVISDVGYTPLVPDLDEDGIRFPLEKDMIVISESFKGGSQETAISEGLASMAKAAQLAMMPQTGGLFGDEKRQRDVMLLQSNGVVEQLKLTPNWLEIVIKPINGNGAFNRVYNFKCTKLMIPKMIDLQAESTT